MIRKLSYNKYIFITTSFIFLCLWFFIFYNQSIAVRYISDLPGHLKLAMDAQSDAAAGYSLLHQFIKFLAYIFSFTAISKLNLYTGLMIFSLVGSLFFTLLILKLYFQRKYNEVNPYLIDFIVISLMIVSMIIFNPFSRPFYLGTGTPNPWHNPTYIFCKPFSLIAFIFLLSGFDKHINRKSYYKELLILSLISILSMWAKPSFFMSFLPAVALVLSYKFLRKEISFKFLTFSGLALLPSLIPLILVNNQIYHSEQTTNTIIFTFGTVCYHFSNNLLISMIAGMAFPLFVFVVTIKRLSFQFLLSFTNFVIAALIFFFVAEGGDRMFSANFAWGYLFAMFFMFLTSCEEFFFKQKSTGWIKKIG